MNIELKRVSISNVKELQAISRRTFYETFKDYNTDEDMNKYLNENLAEDRLIKEIQNENSEFYLAIDNTSDPTLSASSASSASSTSSNQIVGYLKINMGESQTEIRDKDGFEIERIYVVKEYMGKKVGQILFNKALEIAKKQTMVQYVWLGVYEKNQRAINFYLKNGFIEFDKHTFVLGTDEQTDIMMKLTIR